MGAGGICLVREDVVAVENPRSADALCNTMERVMVRKTACIVLVSALVSAGWWAAVAQGADKAAVYVRGDAVPWQPLAHERTNGRISFTLDPAQHGVSTLAVLINPPAHIDINDAAPPVIIGLKADGKPLPTADIVHLGLVSTPPQELLVGVADYENALAVDSVAVGLNGRPLRDDAVAVQVHSPSRLSVAVRPGEVPYGEHEVRIVVRDASPQANEGAIAVRFQYQDLNNFALAAQGTTVRVSSAFTGYDDPAPLIDGHTVLSGTSCGPDVTWASAETAADHWAELTFTGTRTVREVTIYWAAYTDRLLTPRGFMVQVMQANEWHTVYRSPDEGEPPARLTTVRFTPVETDQVRVYMPQGQGSKERPNLLWIAEIEAR